jgi:Flp pilus assembly pilin Flp
MRVRQENGAASAEYAGLVLLIALLAIGAVAALAAAPPTDEASTLGSALDRKIRCPARLPDPCWQDPLTEAYGRPVAGLVRGLAPTPGAVAGPSGLGLVPVDFRYCRSESCAVPGDRPGLTRSNRRVTAFTSVVDHRRSGGSVEVSYWLYMPGIGWDRAVRNASAADVERYAGTPLLDSANPVLVPLETLYGRDHYDFPPDEEPPWRWEVDSVYPG